MKIFKVRIDNDPGGWKSGEDHSELVLAETEEEAINKVKNGWGNTYNYKNNYREYGIGEKFNAPHISKFADISASEIKFDGVEITTVREEKLKRLLK